MSSQYGRGGGEMPRVELAQRCLDASLGQCTLLPRWLPSLSAPGSADPAHCERGSADKPILKKTGNSHAGAAAQDKVLEKQRNQKAAYGGSDMGCGPPNRRPPTARWIPRRPSSGVAFLGVRPGLAGGAMTRGGASRVSHANTLGAPPPPLPY